MIAPFHFLRPWWLLLVPAAAGLLWLWRRQADPRAQWGTAIAPHLLDALIVGGQDAARWRPVHLIAVALVLSGIAAAGPTWHKEPPPFGQDQAPMLVAIDLAPTMDATDVAPTRLERVKQKVRDLLALRRGARTGLVVYAGTAHLVVPPAEDPALIELFLDALSPDLMPVAGRNAGAALTLADGLLTKEQAPGTIVVFADGLDPAQIPAFATHGRSSLHDVLVLGVGTAQGGPIRTKDGGIATDAGGRPIQARFDEAVFRRLSSEAGIPVASVRLDDADVAWIARHAQQHLDAARTNDTQLRWHESGYWLTFPVALLGALWFRRGWVVRWAAGLLLAARLCAPAPSHAAVVDWFLTPDQQGRWHFDHGDYAGAAARFTDPLWKGTAYHRAGDLHAALGEFARLDSPEAFLLMGNCQARLGDYARAVAAYDNALAQRPQFPEAAANRELVAKLLAREKQKEDEATDPNEKADDVTFDQQGKRGKAGLVDAPLPKQVQAELWMRNLKIAPGDFLRQKFLVQASELQDTAPKPPEAP